eukprot:g36517.t1
MYTYTASSDGRYEDNVLYDARLAFDNSVSTTHMGTGPYDATTGVWSGSLGVTGKTISGGSGRCHQPKFPGLVQAAGELEQACTDGPSLNFGVSTGATFTYEEESLDFCNSFIESDSSSNGTSPGCVFYRAHICGVCYVEVCVFGACSGKEPVLVECYSDPSAMPYIAIEVAIAVVIILGCSKPSDH